ncbi:MAG: 3-beta hydroxysteroid dehydrogenase [Elusimicrobia bacterium GWA2_69_24]|nr:MAG: 3-beta hydroxysteroid dehydrogenase [Elusimicrobia bacterium GWA2_69_24]
MKALVTGGGGFLGSALCRRLAARGDSVRSFSRNEHPALRKAGIELVRGDLADQTAVAAAAKGCDIVFHVGAKAGIWGPYEEYHRTNVQGTANVLDACRLHGIRRLVYTSSPSVVFNGRDMEGADESARYPERYEAHYPETKAAAERMVLRANGPALAAVALRPHLIWGPGDTQLLPRLIARRKAGKLRRLSGEPKRVDTVYIDNAVDAHVLAGDRLQPGSPIAGKAYFITNGEPLPLWELVDRLLAAAGLPPVAQSISPRQAYWAGALMELAYGFLIPGEPPMTRFLARELSTAHWFNIRAAGLDLGYHPKVSIDEGLHRLRCQGSTY